MRASDLRTKMCKSKVSFNNMKKAQIVADKHNQRVYECRVCFCYHLTNKKDWKREFIPIEKYNHVLAQNKSLQEQQTKMKELKKFKNRFNNSLYKLNKNISKTKKIIQKYVMIDNC